MNGQSSRSSSSSIIRSVGVRKEQRDLREDARAPLPDQQMRSEPPRFPVDRYLVESSKNIEMVNIIDDDIWKPEPALRPEDEIILRKLHEMLQSTADDLKLLSGELARHREPGVQVKTLPTPLDEEFNEKVHIEEVVNAKFHGYKIVDRPTTTSEFKNKDELREVKSLANNLSKLKVNAGTQVNTVPTVKKPTNKSLVLSRTKVIQIDEKKQDYSKNSRLNNAKVNNNNTSAVKCSQFSYIYEEPKVNLLPKKILQVQDMPKINIRSELIEQKVLHLDILPENQENKHAPTNKTNIAVITMQHKPSTVYEIKPIPSNERQHPQIQHAPKQLPDRKVSKMSTCESTGSTNNVSSDAQDKKSRKQIKVPTKSPPKHSIRADIKRKQKPSISRKQPEKRCHLNLDEWKRKLNAVYGQPSTSRKSNLSTKPKTNKNKSTLKNSSMPNKLSSNILNNNTDYIPYSQLTLGGVRVSDIEKEISDIPNKNELPLSPILDRILSSRENSFQKESPRKKKEKDHTKILTTSDENLLQEVIDIERTVSATLSNKKHIKTQKNISADISSDSNNHDEIDSYADDFEDEKSEADKEPLKPRLSNPSSESDTSDNNPGKSSHNSDENDNLNSKTNIHDATYTKKSNLSFKNKVDVYEFVHSVGTQDIATQSTSSQKISLKETQTSPRSDRPNIQPIHNDLWSSVDPKGEVEKMLKLEKEFIKKLIIEEYEDLMEKNITRPSTSKNGELLLNTQNNVISSQKNTQTSPAHVKSIMTSPTPTKTRTTSPFTLTVPVDRQTSPMIYLSQEELKIEIDTEVEDLGISINLSSPRFSLRLPQTSREVLSNLESSHPTPSKSKRKEDNQVKEPKSFRKITTTSSSSVDADNSSSEISSLGEIKLKLRRKLRKNRVLSISDTSSSSLMSKCSSDLQSVGILPLRSEGELSLGQTIRKDTNKRYGSDGEMSAGRLV